VSAPLSHLDPFLAWLPPAGSVDAGTEGSPETPPLRLPPESKSSFNSEAVPSTGDDLDHWH